MSQVQLMNLNQTESFMETIEVVSVVAIAFIAILYGVSTFMAKSSQDAVMLPADKEKEDKKANQRKMIGAGAVILGLSILYFYWGKLQQFFY